MGRTTLGRMTPAGAGSFMRRRTVLQAGLAWTAAAVAAPGRHSRCRRRRRAGKDRHGRAAHRGLCGLAEAEVAGARLAIEEINHSGGILGREAQLLVTDLRTIL